VIGKDSANCRWPLFCCDLEQARGWVLQRIQSPERNDGQTAHWALSLGMHATVQKWLDAGIAPLSAAEQRGLEFRLARNQRQAQPHRLLFTTDAWAELTQRWAALLQGGKPVRIALQGGVGDHLQDLSALLPCIRALGKPMVFHLHPSRADPFQRLLSRDAPDVPSSIQSFAREEGVHVLELMALLGETTLQPQTWIHSLGPSSNQQRLLCCWTALGYNDHFSAWSRSVPFPAVLALYQQLIAQGWPPKMIMDISRWRDQEATQLSRLGLERRDPAAGDLLDIADLTEASTAVVSIDTALIHLCAAMGRSATLLLPHFADERWLELLQPGSSYSKHCHVIRQRYFGSWQAEITRLGHQLGAGNPSDPG